MGCNNSNSVLEPPCLNEKKSLNASPSDKVYKNSSTDSQKKLSKKSKENFINSALKAHNEYRKLHNAEPLNLSVKLTKIAQDYAEKLATNNEFKHSENEINGYPLGENLYMYLGNEISGKLMTDDWYNEISNYNFNKNEYQKGTGHFTQIIWKGTKNVGFGYSINMEGAFVAVANYFPAGNLIYDFRNNVENKATEIK